MSKISSVVLTEAGETKVSLVEEMAAVPVAVAVSGAFVGGVVISIGDHEGDTFVDEEGTFPLHIFDIAPVVFTTTADFVGEVSIDLI
jgi:hypothetical protein